MSGKSIRIMVFGCLLATAWLPGQETQSLQQVRQEIQKLESDLRTARNREKSLVDQVEDLNREIGLRQQLTRELEKERNLLESRLSETRKSLARVENEYETLKDVVSRRLVTLYKRGRLSEWEILLSMKSLNQIAVWLKYKKRIVDNDRRNLSLLKEKQTSIVQQNQTLERGVSQKRRVIQEKEKETSLLEKRKREEKSKLATVQKDMTHLREKLRNRRQAFEKIQGMIQREEARRRSAKQPQAAKSTGFSSSRGKLSWPIQGQIVAKHGRHKHPVLNTYYENLGIEIRGDNHEAVVAVKGGIVRMVTWQRGMGNLVLMDHGDGYYTVYGHMAEVFVAADDEVKEGAMLGRVGERGGLYGSDLHFEVWNKDKHYDPEVWLN